MTTKTIPRPADLALPNGRGKRIHLSRAELDAMQLIYPENTETMPDAAPQIPILFYLMMSLRRHFHTIGQTAAVVGDTFIFYIEDDTQARFAADLSVTLGVAYSEVVHDGNYYSWLLGTLPHLVIEAGSPSTSDNDLDGKFGLYARLRVPEYWLFDVPSGKTYGFLLRGYRLIDGEYHLIAAEEYSPTGVIHYRSRILNLDFCIPDGATELADGDIRLYNPETREYFPTVEEWSDDSDAASARAELERNLRLDAEYREAAERERRREAEASAKESDDRASQLEELLRQLGLSHLAPNPKGDNHDREDDTAP